MSTTPLTITLTDDDETRLPEEQLLKVAVTDAGDEEELLDEEPTEKIPEHDGGDEPEGGESLFDVLDDPEGGDMFANFGYGSGGIASMPQAVVSVLSPVNHFLICKMENHLIFHPITTITQNTTVVDGVITDITQVFTYVDANGSVSVYSDALAAEGDESMTYCTDHPRDFEIPNYRGKLIYDNGVFKRYTN